MSFLSAVRVTCVNQIIPSVRQQQINVFVVLCCGSSFVYRLGAFLSLCVVSLCSLFLSVVRETYAA